MKKALIVYFSGTAGTKRVAEQFEAQLVKHDYSVFRHSLDIKEFYPLKKDYSLYLSQCELILVLYPVYALDAPKPIYEWADILPENTKIKTAVISVSGGGDMFPNLSCRAKIITKLEKKGFNVFYERMMIMPCNVFFKITDDQAMWLLKSLPGKVEQYSSEIAGGVKKRFTRKLSDFFLKPLMHNERRDFRKLAAGFFSNEKCNSCGWCERNCPRENITLRDNSPVFGANCVACLRCIYGCPQAAISTKLSFIPVKGGFNIKKLEEKMKDKQLQPIEECTKGIFWIGVRKYLRN